MARNMTSTEICSQAMKVRSFAKNVLGSTRERRMGRGGGRLGEPGPPLFEFAEVERPHLRQPLHDQVLELAQRCPELLSLDSRDLHPASWFAVTWVPIYR